MLFVNLGLKEQTLLAAAVYDEAMREMHKVSRPITVREAALKGVFPAVLLVVCHIGKIEGRKSCQAKPSRAQRSKLPPSLVDSLRAGPNEEKKKRNKTAK